ncbi:type IV secretory system conjugative DNA transfer family protein [Streptomyces sp. NBC_01235]|uniref:type IV secretory system conjugative DNA transfer family protein n=1 Tax=Streptomyces sp. NBC_01235 TaxID=2903788 RepID=UPI002E10E1B5|nr:type IV secretion system DNA-binding domain-containing protein [Streptomyces sp. NBC_01235]
MVGIDNHIADELPGQLQAQLPGLVLVPLDQPMRPTPLVAANVRLSSLAEPLRIDMTASVTAGLLEIMNTLTRGQSVVVQWVIGAKQSRRTKPEAFNIARALGLVAVAKETTDDRRLWKLKTVEPLFLVRGRIGARARDPESARLLVRRLGEALQLVSSSRAELWISRATVRSVHQLDDATTDDRWSGILNVAELASVVGWPVDGANSSVTGRGRQYPAPSALLVPVEGRHQPATRSLGAGLHPSQRNQLVTLPGESALHHLHVVGPTGSGKSTLLGQLLHADVVAGRSVFVLEPRGDLVEAVLAGVPAERRQDVVVIEPGSSGDVVGFNPLAGRPEDAEQRADHLLHLFRELYGTSLGPRSSDVLMHALVALSRSDQSTLADLPVLLTNAAFRRRVLADVNDALVLAPFFSWYDGLSEAERQQVISPVLNKTRAFLSRTAIRRLLGQAAPRFQMDELFQRPRIVLVNLNTGVIGAETSQMIGALLVTQLWQAMQRRAVVPSNQRRPVMVVIDEVQQYLRLPVDLGDMFAQARGLGVGLTVAHQHMGQLPPKMRAGIIANARNRVVFRPSSEDASALASVLGGGLVTGDLSLLGAHEAYAEVLVNRRPSDPFLIRTRQPDSRVLSDPADLRRDSAARFGVDGPALDEELRQRWNGNDARPDGRIGQQPRRTA